MDPFSMVIGEQNEVLVTGLNEERVLVTRLSDDEWEIGRSVRSDWRRVAVIISKIERHRRWWAILPANGLRDDDDEWDTWSEALLAAGQMEPRFEVVRVGDRLPSLTREFALGLGSER